MSNGLGPTRLISPLRTFMSSGNSSRLVERNILPNRVNRSTSGSNIPSGSLFSVIVLNLNIINGLPFSPGLVCLKITGDPNLNRIRANRTRQSRIIKGENSAMSVRSKILFVFIG